MPREAFPRKRGSRARPPPPYSSATKKCTAKGMVVMTPHTISARPARPPLRSSSFQLIGSATPSALGFAQVRRAFRRRFTE